MNKINKYLKINRHNDEINTFMIIFVIYKE